MEKSEDQFIYQMVMKEQLIKIFNKIIKVEDCILNLEEISLLITTLLHGVEPSVLKQKILDGKSITIVDKECKFYSSDYSN